MYGLYWASITASKMQIVVVAVAAAAAVVVVVVIVVVVVVVVVKTWSVRRQSFFDKLFNYFIFVHPIARYFTDTKLKNTIRILFLVV